MAIQERLSDFLKDAKDWENNLFLNKIFQYSSGVALVDSGYNANQLFSSRRI